MFPNNSYGPGVYTILGIVWRLSDSQYFKDPCLLYEDKSINDFIVTLAIIFWHNPDLRVFPEIKPLTP